MANLTRSNSSGRSVSPWRDFFDTEFFGSSFPQMRSSMPAVNLSESENNYDVEVVAPGYKKEDFKLKVNDDILTNF